MNAIVDVEDDPKVAALRSKLSHFDDLVAANPDLTEIWVNPDGQVWIEKSGREHPTDHHMTYHERVALIRLVSGSQGLVVGDEKPQLTTAIPFWGGARWTSILPPVVTGPHIAIRIPPQVHFSLEDLLERETISDEQYEYLVDVTSDHKNVIICGGTGSGKTTVFRAMLKRIEHERIVAIEDTPELYIASKNSVKLLTSPRFNMADCLKLTLRLSPKRIMVGEIRDGETAKQWLNAANTGHPGSFASIHTSSALQVFTRFESLLREHLAGDPNVEEIREAIHVAVFVSRVTRTNKGKTVHVREVSEIVENGKVLDIKKAGR